MPALLTLCQSCNTHHEQVYWNQPHGWICEHCEALAEAMALADLEEIDPYLTELPSRCGCPQDDGAPVEGEY